MRTRWVLILAGLIASAAGRGGEGPALFRKQVIDDQLPAIAAAVADINGDGKLDVFAAGGPGGWHSEWATLLYWYEAPGWTKRLVDRLPTNSVILHVESVDFTDKQQRGGGASRRIGGEGPPPSGKVAEFSVTEGFHGDVWWYRYDRAQRKWMGSIVVPGIKYAHGSAAGDIDGDGYVDLLVPTNISSPQRHGLIWAKNPGSAAARAQPWPTYPVDADFLIGGAHYARLVDLNGDGRLDALHAASLENHGGWFAYWLQGKDSTKPWERQVITNGVIEGATNLDAADLNGDGKADLVGTEGHGAGVWWFPAPDYKPVRIDDTLKSAHCLALGDFDGNGAIDIVTCGYESKKVACFLNDGKGKFRMVIIDADQQAYDAKAVDLDGDGDLDILLSGQFSGNLVWYENVSPHRARD